MNDYNVNEITGLRHRSRQIGKDTDMKEETVATKVSKSELIERLGSGLPLEIHSDCEDCWSKTGYSREYWRYHFAGLAMTEMFRDNTAYSRTIDIATRHCVNLADSLLNMLENNSNT